MKKYANIPVPALAIFAIPHFQPKWMADSADPKVREAAKASLAAIDALATRQAKAFEDGVPTANVVRLSGADHYVYLSNEADVLREMKSFFSTLRLQGRLTGNGPCGFSPCRVAERHCWRPAL